MKGSFFIIAFFFSIVGNVMAYDFSAVSPSGHTLYYNIVDGHAKIVRPGTGSGYNNYVTGDLIIPASVTYNFTNYDVTALAPVSGYGTFEGCSGLTSVTIPSSVTSIGYYAFVGCSSLTTTVYTGTIAQWCSISFSGSSSNPLCYSHSLTIDGAEITNLVIPEGVTSIGNYAFAYCSSLTSVTIPSSVTSIGNYAFAYCSSLTSVTIPSSVTSIGGSAFSGCSGLTSVTIPSSVTSIGNYAFFDCSGLTSVTIPSSVTSIGNSAFDGCSGLTSVTIPSSVTSIGSFAFYNVRHIEYYGSATGSPWGAISMNAVTDGDFVFSDATKHYLLAYIGAGGDVTIPSTVDTIGREAFYSCSGLTSVTIPSSVTSIGNDAFFGCSRMTVMRMTPATPPSLGNMSSINDSIIDLVVPHNSYWTYANANSYYIRHHIYCDTVFFAVNVNDTARGIVAGYNSIYTYPGIRDTITLTTLPTYGYHFSHWGNGDTCNVRRLANITHDTSVTAYFDKNKYTIYASADTVTHGHISYYWFYPDSYDFPVILDYLTNVRLTAHGKYGYHFTHWQDGNTNNPRTFILTQDTQFVAYYDKNVYTLTFQSNNSDIGIVNTTSVSSEYLDTTMQIYATAIPHHHFVRWNDNNTENPRRFVFDDNHTYTAYFAIDEHTVNVQVDNLAHGTVSGAGTLEYGQPATVSATPYSGYQFAHWSDGSTYNPYTFAVLEDKSLTAIFIADGEPWQDTVVVYDTAYITLHDTTYINVPVHDTTFFAVHDTTYINIHDTTYVTLTDTVINTVYDTVTNTVYDTIDNYIYDTVTVTDTLWLTQFDTVWLHDTVIIHDTIYITNEGIGDVEAMAAKVYASKGQIVVDGANGNRVTLYDVNGRVLATKRDEYALLHFNVTASGTYIIKIGNYPARKVVVIR